MKRYKLGRESSGVCRCLPLSVALLIGLAAAVSVGHSLPAVALSEVEWAQAGLAAPDGNAITLAQYAEMFGLDLTDPAVAAKVLNRAVLDFQFTEGDILHGLFPDWLERVFKIGGAWGQNVDAWYVPAGESGQLCLVIERSLIEADLLELQIEFYDDPNASSSLFVDLVNEREEILASSGNLLEGSGEIVVKGMILPLRDYPEARGIYLRARGEIFVLGALLVDQKNTSDSDGDGISHYDEVGRTVPGEPVAHQEEAEVGRGARPAHGGVSAEPIQEATAPAAVSPALRAQTVKAQSLGQFVQALMSGADLQITRYALSAGGTRLSSPNFVLQATLGQPLAGFMTNSDHILYVGFQIPVFILPEILNVGVVPSKFNHELGEIATLSYILDVASTGVTVSVAKGLVTNTLVSAEYQDVGLNTLNWSGTNSDGTPATPGNWTFRITAACTGQTTSAVAQVRVANNIPVIRAVSDEPELFCPAQGLSRIYYTTADKSATGLSAIALAPAGLDVKIDLEDMASNVVTTVAYADQPVGAHTQEWSGTDAALFGPGGSFMPNGIYRYRLNASRPGRAANEKSGVIVLACDMVATNRDALVELRYSPDSFTVAITRPTGSELKEATFALITAEPSLFRESPIYEIKTTPPVTLAPPALLTFKYGPELSGDIADKLQIRRYDTNTAAWVVLPHQAVDFVHHQVIAEATNLASFYALFSSGAVAPAGALVATVRLEPEVLQVNPGILTAFVSLPEGYPASGITSATCDGALYERMMLNDDGTEMIIKFRRQAIEAALAQQGEVLDTHFVVEVTWQGAEGSLLFRGEADIRRIVN